MKADRTCSPRLFIVYIEGREAERASRPGPGQVRAGDQPQDCASARSWCAADTPRPRQRADRI